MPTHTYMDLALDEAHAAAAAGEVPIGCVITCDGDLIAQAGNRTLADRDPTAHAEIVALRQAAPPIPRAAGSRAGCAFSPHRPACTGPRSMAASGKPRPRSCSRASSAPGARA